MIGMKKERAERAMEREEWERYQDEVDASISSLKLEGGSAGRSKED